MRIFLYICIAYTLTFILANNINIRVLRRIIKTTLTKKRMTYRDTTPPTNKTTRNINNLFGLKRQLTMGALVAEI